jgi:hypothetical protein
VGPLFQMLSMFVLKFALDLFGVQFKESANEEKE